MLCVFCWITYCKNIGNFKEEKPVTFPQKAWSSSCDVFFKNDALKNLQNSKENTRVRVFENAFSIKGAQPTASGRLLWRMFVQKICIKGICQNTSKRLLLKSQVLLWRTGILINFYLCWEHNTQCNFDFSFSVMSLPRPFQDYWNQNLTAGLLKLLLAADKLKLTIKVDLISTIFGLLNLSDGSYKVDASIDSFHIIAINQLFTRYLDNNKSSIFLSQIQLSSWFAINVAPTHQSFRLRCGGGYSIHVLYVPFMYGEDRTYWYGKVIDHNFCMVMMMMSCFLRNGWPISGSKPQF